MVSISKPMSASAAVKYHFGEHGKNDYYTKTEGTWLGKGAEELGLTGTVTEKEFAAICAGVDPRTGERLVQAKTKDGEQQHVAGVDITFSLPKSASLAALGDPKIDEIFNRVVDRTLGWAEQNLAQGRMVDPETGKQVSIDTGNIVVAKFNHMTSRENEPQKHAHGFLASITKRPDDKTVALHNAMFYKAQKAMGRVFDNEMIHELRKAGYEVNITSVEKGTWELAGIKPELCKAMSTRAEQVEMKIAELKTNPNYAGKTNAELREIANLSTRKDKVDLSPEQLKENWTKTFEEHGETFKSVTDKVHALRDKNLEARAAEKAAGINPALTAEHASTALARGAELIHSTESAFTLPTLVDQSLKGALGEHSIAEYSQIIPQQFVELGYKTDAKGTRQAYLSTPEMIRMERGVVDKTTAGIGRWDSPVTKERVEEFLDRKEAEKSAELTAKKLARGEIKGGEVVPFKYSAGQREYVVQALSGKDEVLVVQGDPGTGKTTARVLIEAFNDELKTAGESQHFVIGAGFTGKAAAELVDRGVNARTIDSFLQHELIVASHPGEVTQDQPGKIIIPQGARVELLVDEASMISSKHISQIYQRAAELREQGIQTKIVLSGDTKQMVAIGAGKMFAELQNTDTTTVELKQINRQKPGTYTLEVAEALNNGKQVDKAIEILEKNERVFETKDRPSLIAKSVEDCMKTARYNAEAKEYNKTADPDKQRDLQTEAVVTPLNANRKEINQKVREKLVAEGLIQEGNKFEILTAGGLSGSKAVAADNFQVGQVVIYSGRQDERGKVRDEKGTLQPGCRGEVVSADVASNSVTVLYEARNGQKFEHVHQLKDDWKKLSTYKREERNFATGDRVTFLKNDKKLGVQNGDSGTITIEGNKAIVELDTDDKRTVEFNLSGASGKGQGVNYNYLDHAYSVTVEKSQGASWSGSIFHAEVRPLKVQNEQGELSQHFGKKVAPEALERFNTTMTKDEAAWSKEGILGGHKIHVSVQLADVGKNGSNNVQKVVALRFPDSKAIIQDENTLAAMRSSGMFFDSGSEKWMTSLSNAKAAQLLGENHPFQGGYKAVAEKALSGHAQDMAKSTPIADARPSLEREHAAVELFAQVTYNAFNVGLTRGIDRMTVNTNDLASFKQQMHHEKDKESTITGYDTRDLGRPGGEKAQSGTTGKEAPLRKDSAAILEPMAERTPELQPARGSDFATSAEKRRTAMHLPFAKGIESGAGHKHDFTLGGTGLQWERDGLFKFGDRSAVRGYTDRGYGEYNTRIKKETRYIQTGENKGTVATSKTVANEGHSTTDRTIKRKDGTSVESKEYGYRTDIGYSLKQKDEVIKDASGEKIGRQKSTTHSFAGQVWGTKKIYGKDGSVKVVKWRGHYGFGGKLKIDKQTITTETNKKVADRAFKPLGQRIVNAVAEKLAIHAAKKDHNQQKVQDLISRAIEHEQGKGHDSDVKSKRVEHGGKYKQEDTITRVDGSVIKAVEKGETLGATKKSVRVETIEKGANFGAKKIIETNRTGNVMTVKTKEVSRFGKIKETEWHGLKQADGTYKTVGQRMSKEYTDIPGAKKVLMTTKEKVLDKVLQVIDKFKDTTKSAEKTKNDRELSKGGMSL